jgi:type II secretory pathway component GspD/PulD (secretin)
MPAGIMLAVALIVAQSSCAQTSVEKKVEPQIYQTFFLVNAAQQNDLNDLQTDLRNLLPNARIYGMPSQNAISLRATAEDMAQAQKVIAELDRPKKVYRLIYTIKETDGGKEVGTRRYSLIATSGARAEFKQGNRVPVTTGSYDKDTSTAKSEVTYIDVGLSIDAHLEKYSDGVRLETKIGQSAVAEERSGLGLQDPLIRSTELDTTSTLELGKPLALGSIDVPGSAHSEEIAVVAEFVR